jgi:hypothetical protein
VQQPAIVSQEGASLSQSRSVRLFLADGVPQGVVVADVGNWSGKVLSAPRGRVLDLLKRSEASRTGVYILIGPNPDRPGGSLAYIGEADDIAARMRTHLRSEHKDFFDRLIIIVSSDGNLTKAHVRYIESQLIRLTREAGSIALTNDTLPDFQRLPEADIADMDYFVAQLRLVLPILGFDPFRGPRGHAGSIPIAVNDVVFTFSTAGASAIAREADDGFIVLAGSTARRGATETFPAGYRALRDQLVADGRLVHDPTAGLYRFTSDTVFASPSAAASIVAARSASGPLEWKIRGTGQTYRDWRAATLE